MRFPASLDHLLALVGGHGQRFLAQHVNASVGGADGVLRVHRVGQRDVDRIDLLETGVVFVVRERAVDAIFLPERLELGSVVAHKRGQA